MQNSYQTFWSILLVPGFAFGQVEEIPANSPMPPSEATLLGPFENPSIPRDVYYKGEPAKNGVIDLIPEASFFSNYRFEDREVPEGSPSTRFLVKDVRDEEKVKEREAARALGVAEAKAVFAKRGATPEELAELDEPGDATLPIARWHLYCSKPGQITMRFFMRVNAEQAKTPWVVEMAQGNQLDTTSMLHQKKESKELKLAESDANTPQPQTLTFEVGKPGRVTFYFDHTKMPEASGAIAFIRLTGSAVEEASLLRAGRRPSAFYWGFSAPEGCEDPWAWVVETKPVEGSGAFVPMKTPFGYTGRYFYDKFLPADSDLHWSMWGSALQGDGSIDMTRAPRIIAQDNPEFAVQVSAREGTTVRGTWNFYTEPARSVIQAMRTMVETDGATTYIGHLYDESAGAWRLYNAAQWISRWGLRPPESGQTEILPVKSISAFLEVPGAYGIVMSGDIPHTFARRGWFQDKNGRFHPVPFADAVPKGGLPEEVGLKDVRNMLAIPAADYEKAGWVLLTTGGITHYEVGNRRASQYPDPAKRKLPKYLQSDKVKSLERLPVRFGETRTVELSPTAATVGIDIEETGANSRGILFFGEHDRTSQIADMKSVPKFEELEKLLTSLSPEEKKEFLSKGGRFHNQGTERARLATVANGWRQQTEKQTITEGRNLFKLKNLKPGTRYFYRLQVAHDTGMSWMFTSGSFTTPEQ